MRSDLFEIIESINEILNSVVDLSAQVLFRVIEKIADAIDFVVDLFFKALLIIVDRQRVFHTNSVSEQEKYSKELDALIAATKVKDDAISNGWNPSHTNAINELSSILLNECNWEEEAIHDYMKKIVECVPGLEYRVENDENI